LEYQMKKSRQTILALAVAATAFGAYAQTDAAQVQHHPATAAKKAAMAPAAKEDPMVTESMAAMDSKMMAMREMHNKVMAAKSPEERQALMSDQMKVMQDGMGMMGSMGKMGDMKGMGSMASGAKLGGMSMDMMSHHAMMEKRMEMMTTMMQMMMDRLPSDSPR
jgi:hypothetical protein